MSLKALTAFACVVLSGLLLSGCVEYGVYGTDYYGSYDPYYDGYEPYYRDGYYGPAQVIYGGGYYIRGGNYRRGGHHHGSRYAHSRRARHSHHERRH